MLGSPQEDRREYRIGFSFVVNLKDVIKRFLVLEFYPLVDLIIRVESHACVPDLPLDPHSMSLIALIAVLSVLLLFHYTGQFHI